MEIQVRIEEGLCNIRPLLPHTGIVWSDILLGLFYYGEVCTNYWQQYHSHSASLYWQDGLHITNVDKLFCDNVHSVYFVANPAAAAEAAAAVKKQQQQTQTTTTTMMKKNGQYITFSGLK